MNDKELEIDAGDEVSPRAIPARATEGTAGFAVALLRRQFFAVDLFYLAFLTGLLVWIAANWLVPSIRLYDTDGAYPWAASTHGPVFATILGFFLLYSGLQRFGLRYQREFVDIGHKPPRWLFATNLVYVLIPLFVVPSVFQQLGQFMTTVSGVPHVSTHPGYDPAVHYDRAATYWDQYLKELDIWLFRVYVPEWIRQFHHPFLTGVLEWCYYSYYFSPFVAVGPLLARRDWKRARYAVGVLMATLMITYIGYILLPATGPRFEGTFASWLPDEAGWFWAEPMAIWLDELEIIRWDAFPSGHTSVSIVCLILALRYHKVVGLVYLPLVVGLVISTMYMGYHYATDVVAGLVTVALVFGVVEPFIKWWERDPEPAPTR